jgi:hypothetical protein
MQCWKTQYVFAKPNSVKRATSAIPIVFAAAAEKHEPAGDIDTAVVDGLKALDPNRLIREADISPQVAPFRFMSTRPNACVA